MKTQTCKTCGDTKPLTEEFRYHNYQNKNQFSIRKKKIFENEPPMTKFEAACLRDEVVRKTKTGLISIYKEIVSGA